MQTSEPRNQTAVQYLPNGPAGRFLWPLLLLAIFALTFWGGVMTLRTVRFACDRGASVCSVVSSWGPLSTAREIPLASIKKTRLDSSHGKHGYSYEVVLVTSSGDARISMVASSSKTQRTDAKAQIDAFLGDPRSTTLDLVYDEPSFGGFAMLALSLVWVIIGWGLSRAARVEVDRAARTCTVVTLRWPLGPKRRVYPLDDVRDAIVTESRGRKGATYNVALVVSGQEKPVPLLNMSSSGRAWKDGAVADIRALLATASSPR